MASQLLITAGPTCGKTYLAKALTVEGARVIDTDDVFDTTAKMYRVVSDIKGDDTTLPIDIPYLRHSDDVRMKSLDEAYTLMWLAARLGWIGDEPSVVFTNRPIVQKWMQLNTNETELSEFSFYRADPREVYDIIISRNPVSSITYAMVKQWIVDAEARSKEADTNLIWLPQGIIIDDVLDFMIDGDTKEVTASLSEFGVKLESMTRGEALTVSPKTLREMRGL